VSRLLVENVAELLRRPASRRDVRLAVPADGRVVVGEARVPEGAPVEIDVELESLTDGIVVSGRLEAPWESVCRRCLGPAAGSIVVEVRELYQAHPTSDEAYPIEDDQLDLAPMVRESLMLDLPLAPVCRADCAGLCPTCGADLNVGDCGCDRTPPDPRWAVLEQLRGRLDPPTP
jgi:uncharacterized protein